MQQIKVLYQSTQTVIVGTVKIPEGLPLLNEVCYTITKLLFLQMESSAFMEADCGSTKKILISEKVCQNLKTTYKIVSGKAIT